MILNKTYNNRTYQLYINFLLSSPQNFVRYKQMLKETLSHLLLVFAIQQHFLTILNLHNLHQEKRINSSIEGKLILYLIKPP